MGRFVIRCALAYALFGATLVGEALFGAAWAAEPPHNFVFGDLTWKMPEPATAGHYRFNLVLTDAASGQKNGDIVAFDTLVLTTATGTPGALKNGATWPLRTNVVHYEASCGWRTLHLPPQVASDGRPSRFSQEYFLASSSQFDLVVNRLCAGLPITTAQGPASIEAAAAALKNQFDPSPTTNTITVQRVIGGVLSGPASPPWMSGPHSFAVVPAPDAPSHTLFVDRASLVRAGDTVTGISLLVLGRPLNAAAVLRYTRYDCSARTQTVLSQVVWREDGGMGAPSDPAYGIRTASESPVTAVEIAGACASGVPDAPNFANVENAWDFARKSWPPRIDTAWAKCIWDASPAASQEQMMAYVLKYQWRVEADRTIISKCDVPDADRYIALNALSAFAARRAALADLSRLKIDEPALVAGWRLLPNSHRRRLARLQNYRPDDERKWRDMIAWGIAYTLGIAPDDFDARRDVALYITAASALED